MTRQVTPKGKTMPVPPGYTTLSSIWHRQETMPRQLAFRATTREQWGTWREALQARLVDLLGGFPGEKVPLDPVLLEREETPHYRLEKVAFQSEPGLSVPCYVLIPLGIEPPYRPVIAMHGHGIGGAAHIVGRFVTETMRDQEQARLEAMNYDYARQLAGRGFLVFAPEQRGFNERLEPYEGMIREGIGGNKPMARSSCRALALNALLVGKTLLGLRIWDVMRTVDYIRSRPEPMVPTLGCLGLSGGGMDTLFAAALDERITVAVVSGYLSRFAAALRPPKVECECNVIPGILQYAEMSDVAALIAPRPLLVESGADDEGRPLELAKQAVRELERVYTLLRVLDRLGTDFHPGGHAFSGRQAFDWLERWLV